MRTFLQSTAIYLIILSLLLTTLQFSLVDRGSAIIKNFAFIMMMHVSNLKNTLSDSTIRYEELQNAEPQYPLKKVIKKYNGRTILVANSSQIFDGLRVKIKPTNVTINSAGMRDYEYTYNKPANVCRISILGDSYTFGWGVELNETFAKVLERKLNLKGKNGYQVLNFGVPGYGFREEVTHLQEYAIKFSPDIVIIASMRDDFRNYTIYEKRLNELLKNFNETYTEFNGTNVSNFTKTQLVMPQLYPLLNKEENEQFYATTKGQELIETYFGEVMHISKIHDFRTIILILDAVPKQKIIERNVAEKHNWAFIDVSEIFDQTKFEITKTRIRPPYDSHFTPYAHQLVADKLYNEVNWTGLCSKAFNSALPAS